MTTHMKAIRLGCVLKYPNPKIIYPSLTREVFRLWYVLMCLLCFAVFTASPLEVKKKSLRFQNPYQTGRRPADFQGGGHSLPPDLRPY